MIRFADDIAILTELKKDLERVMNGLDTVLREEYKMKINRNKTKVMKCSKRKNEGTMEIKLGNETLSEVDEFCYLGSKITSDGGSVQDIKSRLAQARKAYERKRTLLTSEIGLEVRKSFLKSFVWSIALYGCETWTIGVQEKRRLEASEMLCYRRMLKVRWIDHVTNQEVLNKIGEGRNVWQNLKKRRDKFVGHILKQSGIVNRTLEGRVEGKNCRGRPRLCFINQNVKDVGCKKYSEMKRLAQDRKDWRAASNQSDAY